MVEQYTVPLNLSLSLMYTNSRALTSFYRALSGSSHVQGLIALVHHFMSSLYTNTKKSHCEYARKHSSQARSTLEYC